MMTIPPAVDANDPLTLPDWPVTSTSGEVTLNQIAGVLLLYFYPKDATSACSQQALEFSQLKAEFDAMGVTVYGISRDSLASHRRFIERQNLTIPLISDQDQRLCEHFGVIYPKLMFGKPVKGINRSTFIFDNGQLIHSERKVKAAGHALAMLNWVKTQL